MQSSWVNAMILNLKIQDNKKTGTAKGFLSGGDTFMNMLSEKIADRRNSRFQVQPHETKIQLAKNRVFTDDDKPVNVEKPEPGTKGLDNAPENVNALSEPEVRGESEVEGTEPESGDEDKEEIQEKIDSLEALIALLEELMARLNIKTVSAEPAKSNTPPQLQSVLPADSREINLMELLMALVKEDVAELKEMMSELSQDMSTPEINELFEKIQALLEKLSGGEDLSQLKIEIDGKSVSREELIQQLKSQCAQLIDKLNEQVSALKADLGEEFVQEEQVLNESAKVEPETQHETKDDEEGFAAVPKDADTSQVKTAPQFDNHFEDIIIQNQQIPEKNLIQPDVPENMQFPLSEKPQTLAQTVTNQVVMKVKLMAGESKQEMEMHLKPDSLGKLTLKIIHERGEILAKITAENQQVKEILESNMQMLKDALEKNGYSVQNLSVSVRNGNENNQSKENRDSKGGVQLAGIERMTGTSSQVNTDKRHLRARIEKEYFNDTSQIDLTA